MSNDWRFNILIIQYLNIIEADLDSKNGYTEDENSFHDAVGNQNSYNDVVNSEGEDVNEETNEPNEIIYHLLIVML